MKAKAPATIIASMVQTTPKRTASGVANGAAAIEARPATAVFRPIIEAEWPRVSRMTLSSGTPRPMAMPTTLIEAMAAEIDSQRISVGAAPSGAKLPFIGSLEDFADEAVAKHAVERHRLRRASAADRAQAVFRVRRAPSW